MLTLLVILILSFSGTFMPNFEASIFSLRYLNNYLLNAESGYFEDRPSNDLG